MCSGSKDIFLIGTRDSAQERTSALQGDAEC